jgi:hypothetical protein
VRDELTALSEWERRCRESQIRAWQRREASPHPWPEGRPWQAVWLRALAVALVMIALGYLVLVTAASVAPTS